MAEMSEAEKQILQEVEYFRDKYFTYDEPVPFNGLQLYPVHVRNYNEFLSSSSCCSLNKNDDPNGMKQTNLEYLLNKMRDEKEGPIWSMKFTKLIELCLHVKSGLKCPKCGKFMSFEEYIQKYQDENITDKNSILICECGEHYKETISYKTDEKSKKPILIIDGIEINGKDFTKLRKYILYQNLPDYKDDSWVDKAIRDDQAAKAELQSRGQGTASLERKIIGLCANTNYKINEIYDLSIRKFIQLLEMIDDCINYKTTKTGLMSGMVTLKKGTTIEHWLYKKEEGMYGKATDADSYSSQIKGA